ncbi:hypothetical protein [Methanocella paludicola]|nr:hypothetical protein [Methanocella paludicola]
MEPEDLKSWYVDAARYFRAMGFFSKYSGLSDEDMAARLMDDVCREWDEPCPSGAEKDPQLADVYLLTTDRERVWHGDLEFVYPGENAYVQFLNELAAISRGAFRPLDVSEKWKGERGPVDVEFTAGGRRFKFVHGGGDMLDPAIVRTVNEAIKESGVRFEVCDNLGMPNFIVALTSDERARLAARGWKFWPGT